MERSTERYIESRKLADRRNGKVGAKALFSPSPKFHVGIVLTRARLFNTDEQGVF